MDSIKRLYGIYRAVVVDNKDPKYLRRLKVQSQATGPEVTDWIWPVISSKRPPAIGTGTWVTYIGGDPEFPVWLGEFGNPETVQGMFAYGSFYDTTDQSTTAGVSKAMTLNTTDLAEGVSVKNNSRITVANGATYNLQFSAQLHHTGGGGNGNTVNIWLRKNGTDVPNSNTKVTVQSNNPYVVAAWNFIAKLKHDEYVQIMWATDNPNIKIEYEGAGTHPAIPSVIATMTQIA